MKVTFVPRGPRGAGDVRFEPAVNRRLPQKAQRNWRKSRKLKITDDYSSLLRPVGNPLETVIDSSQKDNDLDERPFSASGVNGNPR